MSKLTFGEMMPAPDHLDAYVQRDAMAYKVCGFNWLRNEVLVDRNGGEWLPVSMVAFDNTPQSKEALRHVVDGLNQLNR